MTSPETSSFPESPAVSANPANAVPQTIGAFDQYGREVLVPREEWRTNVLPGMLQGAWDQPDVLYQAIVNSLNDGFVAEVANAAAHLYAIDPIPVRGTCLWAVILIQTVRLPEAEEVLAGFLAQHGPDASVLVNLARVYAERGEKEQSAITLREAVEADPNHENGMGWLVAQAQEQGGDAGAHATLEELAAMPGSWRARLWLARAALAQGDLPGAKQLYAEALQRSPRPVPPDFLMQMSGDLGSHGHLADLLALTAPHFVPEMHGLPVGNNLIKASLDTGDIDGAEAIRNSLVALNRPDWNEPLTFWEKELGKASGGSTIPGQTTQPMQIGMIRLDGPVWLPPMSPARGVFGSKAPGALTVTFMGGTAEAPRQPTPVQAQRSDALGRLTRSLPLFLAEQVDLRTAAAGRALLPWAVAPRSGFVVSSAPWPDETAVGATSDPANRSDYVVSVHIDADNEADSEPWAAVLVFLRTTDGARIGELEARFAPDDVDGAIGGLADEMVELLHSFGPVPDSSAYKVPSGQGLSGYLLRLEQLLAVRCASMDGVEPNFLQGEADILQGQLELCLAGPENVPARLLLKETFAAMERVRPATAEAFRPRLGRLDAEFPIGAMEVSQA